MSNGARHAIGALIGVLAAPLLAAGLLYGVFKMDRSVRRVMATFGGEGGGIDRWVGAGVLVATAILVAVVVAPRVSPIASLLPGVLFTGLGAMWIVDPGWAVRDTVTRDVLPGELDYAYMIVAPYGFFLLLGALLLAASAIPGRWAGRPAGARHAVPPVAPMGPGAPAGPPQMPGAPRPGAGVPPPPQPQGRPEPFAPSFSQPPAPQGTPQGPQGPPQGPQAPPSGAVPFGREDDRSDPFRAPGQGEGEGGEWTRMYGGDDLRRDGR
ncbi:hypothetical protein GCM10010182_57880 [Actinomadura cremea]|nr:hypothetical protein GCM10010182_57880 [Actinomadura cremea]